MKPQTLLCYLGSLMHTDTDMHGAEEDCDDGFGIEENRFIFTEPPAKPTLCQHTVTAWTLVEIIQAAGWTRSSAMLTLA